MNSIYKRLWSTKVLLVVIRNIKGMKLLFFNYLVTTNDIRIEWNNVLTNATFVTIIKSNNRNTIKNKMRKARLSAWKERRVITESEKERRRRRIWTTTNILQSPSSLFSISLFSHLLTFLYLCSYIYLSLLLFLSLSSSFTRKKERDTHKDNISLTIESLRPMSH